MSGGLRVISVDALARASGVVPGVTLADGRALEPNLGAIDFDGPGDAEALEKLAAWGRRYTPWSGVDDSFERPPDGCGDLWLDISGCGHLFGGESALLEDLLMRLERNHIAARAAIADTPGAAWAMARFGGGGLPPTKAARQSGERSPRACVATERSPREWALENTILPPNRLRSYLEPLPVLALRLPGPTVEALSKVGLRRIGDLIPLPRAPLAKRFGPELAKRLDQALGSRSEPLSPQAPPVDFIARIAFPECIAQREDIEGTLERLLEILCKQLEKSGLGARKLTLRCDRVDGGRQHLHVGTGHPARKPSHLLRLFREKLDTVEPGFGIEAMVLSAPFTNPMEGQQDDMEGAAQQNGQGAAELVDRLSNKLGNAKVIRLTPQASHIPECASREAPAMEATPANEPAWESLAKPAPRPIKLLTNPVPIEVLASVPDGPPVRFKWQGQHHRIVSAQGPERIAPEWWHLEAGHPDQTTRDYFQVELQDGRRLWLFREGLYRPDNPPRWYVQGVFG